MGSRPFTQNRTSSIPAQNGLQGGKENSSMALNRNPGGLTRTGNEDQTGINGNGIQKHINFKDGQARPEQFNNNHGGASRGAIKTYQAEKPRSALGQV